jgi:hypothetical protein
MLQVMRDIGGIELPESLVKLTGDNEANGGSQPVARRGGGAGSAATRPAEGPKSEES